MKAPQLLPRNALVWIVISLFTLLAPHAARLPPWVLVVYLFAALWRIMVHRGRWSFPGRWVKLALTAGAFAGIGFSYHSLIGLEPTVALLLTAAALKLLELVERKDAYVLLFLGYFICITEFLFSQHLLVVLYSLGNVLLITTALVALHQSGQRRFNGRSLRVAGVMIGQALPLMLVLFFLFPRIDPLWTVPLKRHTAKTGVSDSMRPGDISRLGRSGEVAFRVRFEGPAPRRSELYWRGLVFSRLEQGTWKRLLYYDSPPAERRPRPVERRGESVRYTVIMAPTGQNWLYSLRYATSPTGGVMASNDFLLFNPVELEDEYLYEAVSWPESALEKELSDWRRRTELQLPAEGNPRTRRLAREMRAAVASDTGLIEAVLDKFREEPFVYTLQPPLLGGEDPMDQFLFQTRRGFCEHFAAAFVVLMRAAGVPARVVAGYQGGEVNPVNRTVIVHQFDAHAWAEVWLEEEGWVRVDPTAAVSPERIEWGLEEAVAEEGTFLADSPLSPLRFRGVNWLNQLRLRYDALTYRWQSWVVGFDGDRQLQLLEEWFGEVNGRRFAAVLLASWAVVLLPVALNLLRRRDSRRLRPTDRHYLLFCDRMAALGHPRRPGEAPGAYAERLRLVSPARAAEVERITGLYSALAYAAPESRAATATDLARQLESAIRRFRPRRSPRLGGGPR